MISLPAGLEFVVDVSVMCDAGQSESDRQKACREVLGAIRRGHRIAWSDQLEDEWRRQRVQPQFARQWLVEMERRQRVRRVGQVEPAAASAAVGTLADGHERKGPMAKDLHLVEAALMADRVVISNDNRARGHFRWLLAQVQGAWGVAWANPTEPADACLSCLNSGAFSKTNFR